MAVKTKRISTLIESQLPEFIVSEYPLFHKFVQKYYEGQEVQGGPLDIASNLQTYSNIDYYEQNILRQFDSLDAYISATADTIVLQDASSFPQANGYVRIGDEIIFYGTRTDTELRECVRGVSGNTTLGDLYNTSTYSSTTAAPHNSGETVYNVSNLFLYALVRNFESQYLGSFPEKYLKGEVDKRTLIKNISKFYKAKGTNSSIEFVFNTLVNNDTKPEVYKPRDYTYKVSNADWISVYALKCKVISGDPKLLIGKKIVQSVTDEYGYADATVDNVYPDNTADGESIWNIVLAPETVNGFFAVSTKTRLERNLPSTDGVGKRIDVFSTIGWEPTGEILIADEKIKFDNKTATQFIIEKRGSVPTTHASGTSVYKPVIIEGTNASLLTLGVVYNLSPQDSHPHSAVGDQIQVSNPGFETTDPKIVKTGTNQPRWVLGQVGNSVDAPTNTNVETALDQVSTDVSALFEDEQYYYVSSSGFPSYKILDGPTISEPVQDQKLLRIIRKQATRTTEVYPTPKRDIGVLLNGVLAYGFKDEESIRYGKLEEIKVNTQGRGYASPPYVLVDGVRDKARAVLSGNVVESIIVDTTDTFPTTPEILITSGRRAEVRAIVTGAKVTSLVIDNAGEYYSSPPTVRIRDNAGRGRFAEYKALLTDGKITDFEKIDEGNFYNQNTVVVDIIPVGEGATGIPLLKEWNKNRFTKLSLDTDNGYVFQNFNNVFDYGYAHVGNPKSLRVALNDNLNGAGTEPATKTHSPIIGFAYDGNPIYGAFGYEDPLDATSSIIRMASSYSIVGQRTAGPDEGQWPLGSFTNDFVYNHKSGTLDQNNGRFCITPDFPEGTYAYFLTIDSNQIPQYPYIIGENFYSLPVDSNYNSDITQDDIPKDAKRLYTAGMPRNGEGVIATISEVKSGTVDSISVDRSSANFSVNSQVYFDNRGTEGSEAESIVSSVKGKDVSYLQSKENKVVKLTTIQTAYLFANDTLRQPSSSAYGEIVGNVASDNVIVLKNVNGTFDNTGTFSADIKTFSLIIDQDSSYTEGAILSLTDGVNAPIATAEILEGTTQQNTLKIKVLTGTWIVDDTYFLQSSNLFNTSGSRIITLTSLSDNLEPFIVNQSVALIETTSSHGLGIGDEVTVDIIPDDATKLKTWYIRKRLYQNIVLKAPSNKSTIDDTGIGRFQILNGGADYTANTYNNVPLTGGSGTGATASITVSNAGIVSNVTIQDSGSDYRKGDYLSVADESLVRSGGSLSSQRLTIYVDHVGFAAGQTSLKIKDVTGFCKNDLVKVGDEILKVVSITTDSLNVDRGQEDTVDADHFNNQEVILYKPQYNFPSNYQIFTGAGTGYIQSYDPTTQQVGIIFDYAIEKSNAQDVTINSTFFDFSLPRRTVSVSSIEPVEYKFEFSEDDSTYVPNINIDIQEYYKYRFDTSHSSLVGTYFDISPSKSYNLITVEKIASPVLPGNFGAYTDVKFGFGSRLATNNYDKKIGTDFANYYYFDKNGIVNSEGKYLKIVDDPLQGVRKVNYVTSNRFVYDLVGDPPLWDGSGTITYTTTGQFAIGEIDSFKIINLGLNYKKIPIIEGCDPNSEFKAKATVLFDTTTNTITGVNVSDKGSNYINPKIVITNGDGVDATFNVVVRDGSIFSITVDYPGVGYTFAPEIEIVESDLDAYVNSSSIGVPQSVSINKNGGAFHLDKTVASKFTSKSIFVLKNFNGTFKKGETLIQKIGGNEVARAVVSEWRSNLLKVENITGIFRQNNSIEGITSKATGTITSVFVTTFDESITSFYDNLGYYKSDKGKLGVSNQKLIDSNFYQDYSYVVKSKTSIEQWRDLIKSTTHPAGFKLFGQVDIESDAAVPMPVSQPKDAHFTIVQLWDPEKNKITVESTKRIVTVTTQKVESQRIRKGSGSASNSEFNFNNTRAFTFTLNGAFDGTYNNDGQLIGTKSFQVLDQNGTPFTPVNAKSLIVTLDGVLQEPEKAYTVSGDNIVFAQPPLGPGTKAGSAYNGVTFYGRTFYFVDNQYNTKYLKKIRNIFERGGRWLDAANQVERNREFIVAEAVGYGKSKYASLDWSTKLDDYQRDIGYIIDGYEHDLRFGGNVKTYDYVNLFNQGSDYEYITSNKTESLDIFRYATNLVGLAIRNWDYQISVDYAIGSAEVTVGDTNNLAVGMYISAGRAFPANTKILSIDSATKVTLSNNALLTSGTGVAAGISQLSGSQSGTAGTNTVQVPQGQTLQVPQGQSFAVAPATTGGEIATFTLSAVNNGQYVDASNLITSNKAYLQEEISEYIYATYTSLQTSDKAKCSRDIGLLIDAITYHLKFGGNEKIVDYARRYWTVSTYPGGQELTSLNRTSDERLAAIEAWNTLKDKITLTVRNNLPTGTYTAIAPVTDGSIAFDTNNPACVEVISSVDTMIESFKEIIVKGPGIIEVVKDNINKSGNWTTKLTYSNYNIIADSQLTAQECDNVISAVDSLYANVNTLINEVSTTRSLPDFIDGENNIFELYWDDSTPVDTEVDEDLFLTINAVLQRPKYTETYPGADAYYINRSVIPNQIIFDVAPICDQDLGAKTLGEVTAIEKVSGIGVANYKRLTIDYNLVDNVKSGPFLILDVEDMTVQTIEQKEFLYVFVDGILQREGYSYTVAGPNIYFNVPINSATKIDMRYLYGRNVGQVLNIYDFNPDSYYAKGVVTLETTAGADDLLRFRWMGDSIGLPVHAYQEVGGIKKIIGIASNFFRLNDMVRFTATGPKAEIDQTLPVVFAVGGKYNINTSVTLASSGSGVVYEADVDGRAVLSDLNSIWSGTLLGKNYRQPFIGISNLDKIRIEGEEGFRAIKKLPGNTTSKEQRSGEPVSTSHFGQVEVERYNGTTRGEGLSVVATIENGSVTKLEWNQRSYDPLTQPTAYQYETPPILHFIPKNGNGGGARASVLVSKGQVISVDLLDGGSGYTEAPQIVVARRYDILAERDIGVVITQRIGVTKVDVSQTQTSSAHITILGTQVQDIASFTSTLFKSPDNVIPDIEAEIQTGTPNIAIGQSGFDMPAGTEQPENSQIVFIEPDPLVIESGGTAGSGAQASIANVAIQDIVSLNSIQTVSKQITSSFTVDIDNTSLDNINYYQVGAYTNVDTDIADEVIYIPDTWKFSNSGYLLIGDEVVRYYRKLTDRFYMVQRGQEDTTAKFWAAGTFLRQVPERISVAPAGVAKIESTSETTTTDLILDVSISTNVLSEITITQSIASPGTTQTEVVLTPPASGAIDQYVEEAFINDPVPTRGIATSTVHTGSVDITDDYDVVQRGGGIVDVTNLVFGQTQDYIGDYIVTNVGNTLNHFDISGWDVGFTNVSGTTLQELDIHYPSLGIQDFEMRGLSAWTLAGQYWRIVNGSIQNPVAISQSTGTIGGPIVVAMTDNFPAAGYIFTSGGTVIQYTSKTATTFEGCTLFSGPDSINAGEDIIPFEPT